MNLDLPQKSARETIKIHPAEDFAGMRAAGRLAAETLDHITPYVKPGVTTNEINDICEKFIRAHELGIYTVAGHLFYYPKSILENHVGLLTLLMAGALAGWSLWSDRMTTSELFTRLRGFRQEFISLGFAILIPVAILTVNVSKSPGVGGIVAVPILLAMVLFIAAVWPLGGRLELEPEPVAGPRAGTDLVF